MDIVFSHILLCVKDRKAFQLLILAGNCRYVRNQVLPDLAVEYEDMISFKFSSKASGATKVSVAEAHFKELEDLLIKSYTVQVKKRLDKLVQLSLADKSSPSNPRDILGVSNNPIQWIHCIIEIQVSWFTGFLHNTYCFFVSPNLWRCSG